jgi:hypothetical protein
VQFDVQRALGESVFVAQTCIIPSIFINFIKSSFICHGVVSIYINKFIQSRLESKYPIDRIKILCVINSLLEIFFLKVPSNNSALVALVS